MEPRTWDEQARLAALDRYQILDSKPEQTFDEIAKLASLLCEAPIAVVNLIARDRQWFKSEIGLGVNSTALATSFCAQALLQGSLVVVKDATKDERFSCNPLVTGEPHLRFYAGAIVETPDHLPLGTVCVLDYKPRPSGLLAKQRDGLKSLARLTMDLLELRLSAGGPA